jgi:hypothetical protein
MLGRLNLVGVVCHERAAVICRASSTCICAQTDESGIDDHLILSPHRSVLPKQRELASQVQSRDALAMATSGFYAVAQSDILPVPRHPRVCRNQVKNCSNFPFQCVNSAAVPEKT